MKERLKQVMSAEAHVIQKMSEEIDYDVLCRIAEIFCHVKETVRK